MKQKLSFMCFFLFNKNVPRNRPPCSVKKQLDDNFQFTVNYQLYIPETGLMAHSHCRRGTRVQANGPFTLHGIGTGTGKWWVSILCYALYTLHMYREPLLVSTYVVCERLSVMHKQVSGWTVNFGSKFRECPHPWNRAPSHLKIEI